jgi:hypothetical protein
MTTGFGPYADFDGARWAQQRSRAIFNAVNRLTGSVDEAVFPKVRNQRTTSLRTWTTDEPG